MFLQPMKKEDISPMTLMSMWNQVRNAATQGVQGGFAKVGETIQKTPLLKLGVNVLNAADYGLGTVAKTTEGLLTDRVNTLKNLKYQRGEGLKSYANRNVTDISPYVTQKVAGTQIGQKFPMVAPLLGLGAGMLTPSPSDALKVGKFASQAGDVAKFSDEATDLVKPSMLDPLASEAKKYKSAEEFVKAQGETVYRGGTKLDVSKINQEGLPVTFDNKVAEQFARSKNQFAESPAGQIMGYQKGQNVVESYQLSPNAKIATRSDIPDNVFNAYKQANPLTKPEVSEPIITKWAKENGFDAIDFRTLGKTSSKEAEIKILNPEILKTKSQLTDIWNKANQSNDLISEARKYKSAEEFVKAQGETLYRGVGGDDGGGNYFTNNKEFSRQFTKNYQDSEIIERIIPDNEIYKAKEIPFAGDESQMNKAIQKAKLNGKKAILVDEGTGWGEQVYSVFAFDKSAIKTKSQLTDIWNKAQGK